LCRISRKYFADCFLSGLQHIQFPLCTGNIFTY
ncbi:hypothetical protein EC01288_3767, partial [Escherichia coli 0.1288]